MSLSKQRLIEGIDAKIVEHRTRYVQRVHRVLEGLANVLPSAFTLWQEVRDEIEAMPPEFIASVDPLPVHESPESASQQREQAASAG